MAVRLLATFPLIDVNGNFPDTMTIDVWYPHVGLLCFGEFPGKSGATYFVTMDGVCQRSAYNSRQNWGWWPSRHRLTTMYADGSESVWEPRILAQQQTDPDTWLEPFNDAWAGQPCVKMLDRWIWFTASYMRFIPGKNVNAAIESAPFPFPYGRVLPGRSNTDVWVRGQATQNAKVDRGCFYDSETKKIASPVYFIGMDCDELVYAPEFGVLISGHIVAIENQTPEEPWKYLIKIWSLEVNPTQLTPVEVAEGSAKSGQVVTYRVQLLGDQDDPAPGELVNWFVEGVGLLLDFQTITNEDGYAFARVQYMVGETGSSKVMARVSC